MAATGDLPQSPEQKARPEGETVQMKTKIKDKRNNKEAVKDDWTEDEDKRLFRLYKQVGTKWSTIVKEFQGRSENQLKNRFYSTLRRVATKKCRENPGCDHIPVPRNKDDLLPYVEMALEFGHNCRSKRGRKKKRVAPHPEAKMKEIEVEFKPFAGLAARIVEPLPTVEGLTRSPPAPPCLSLQSAPAPALVPSRAIPPSMAGPVFLRSSGSAPLPFLNGFAGMPRMVPDLRQNFAPMLLPSPWMYPYTNLSSRWNWGQN